MNTIKHFLGAEELVRLEINGFVPVFSLMFFLPRKELENSPPYRCIDCSGFDKNVCDSTAII